MENNLVFSLKCREEINHKDGSFYKASDGIWLHFSTNTYKDEVFYICDSVEDLDMDELLKTLSPENIFSLFQQYFTKAEMSEIINIIESEKIYFLDLGDICIEIKMLTKEEKNKYVDNFKSDLKEATLKFGSKNVTVKKNLDSYMYEIVCTTNDSCLVYNNEGYALNFLDEANLADIVKKLNCTLTLE